MNRITQQLKRDSLRELWAYIRFRFFLWRRGMKLIAMPQFMRLKIAPKEKERRRKKSRDQKKARKMNRRPGR